MKIKFTSPLPQAFLFFAALFLPMTDAAALPENFQDTVIWSGLDTPTAVSFAPNGKVYVAEKEGIIKVFDNLADTTPAIFADLRSQVHNYSDRGIGGLAVDPQFPARPYVYVFYTMDGPIGSTLPHDNDVCTNPDICPAGSRLSKLTASPDGNTMISEQILIESWCQIENSHSADMIGFGPDGALYVTHGDGASYNYVDFGQDGGCGDPVNEGGALRSQDLRTSGDPVSFTGALLRVNPDTGAAFPGNPLAGGAAADDDRVISYGFRNPFRFSFDTVTGAIWLADVGWNEWEEINYIPNPTGPVNNFGWPCYEGAPRQGGYDAANIPICEALYSEGTSQAPYYAYAHNGGNRAISAIALYRGNDFPAAYNGALFFADYTQGWIRVMMPGANGLPNTANIADFVPSGAFPVDLKVGPNGSLYYVDVAFGTIHQISYFTANTPPTASVSATPISGTLPLSVSFNGSGSFDPDAGDTLQYAWDLDGDGAFDDSTAINPTFNYSQAQTVLARLRVTDSENATSTASVTIYAGNRAPAVTISAPTALTLFNVGDVISFSGSANDPDIGVLPASALTWEAILHHCAINDPSECHEHSIQTFPGVYNGILTAPDHEYPSRLEFRLTAADPVSPALTTTAAVLVEPRTSTWTFTSEPSGLQLAAYSASQTTPFSRTVIVNAQSTISAPLLQQLGATTYQFSSWSDGKAQSHNVIASSVPQTFHAIYTPTSAPSVWHSWEIAPQAGSPQAVAVSNTNISATVEFYESTNDFGITKGSLFGSFTSGAHQEAFNKMNLFWSTITGPDAYPYAGKSTVIRGADTGEGNAPAPTGALDLQLHPPQNDHMTVAAFRIPQDGIYTISDIGVRRVESLGGNTRLRVFDPQGTQLTILTATTNQDWTTTPDPFTISNATAGQYIYFAVDRDGDYGWDAVEVSWTVSGVIASAPPQPTCTFTSNPTSIQQGASTTLSWTTDNAASFSINHGIGSQLSVGSGSISQSPTTTTTYTGTANGPGGSAECQTTVTVTTPPPSSCTLTLTPSSITQGASSTLAWTAQNAATFSINQGIGSVTPVSGGSQSVNPTVTTTYTGTTTGAGGGSTCLATLTVNPPSAQLRWNSWDVTTQAGTPQGSVTSVSGGVTANIEFYESTSTNGVVKSALFNTFTSGAHQDAFNNLTSFWSNGTGSNFYPYAGKSTVGRGSDAGETNAASPLGVKDLQLHPPSGPRNTIAAFRVPVNGTYTVSNIGARRVSNSGNNARLRVYNTQKTQLISLNATNNRQWITNGSSYFTLSNLTAGQYIYFSVDRNGDYSGDATEISWTIKKK